MCMCVFLTHNHIMLVCTRVWVDNPICSETVKLIYLPRSSKVLLRKIYLSTEMKSIFTSFLLEKSPLHYFYSYKKYCRIKNLSIAWILYMCLRLWTFIFASTCVLRKDYIVCILWAEFSKKMRKKSWQFSERNTQLYCAWNASKGTKLLKILNWGT